MLSEAIPFIAPPVLSKRAMRVGICGYPGSGKSTVFSALVGVAAAAARAEGKVAYGSVKVPDERVDYLASVFQPKKKTYAEITFVDVGGGGGAKAGGALPPEVVQAIRNVDAIAHVVRAFDNPALAAPPDPQRDERAFREELVLMDLALMEKRVARLTKENKKGPELDACKRCFDHLEKGEPLRTLSLSEAELGAIGPGIQLLSLSPIVTLYNLSEAAWADPASAALRETRTEPGAAWLAMCGSIEAEIATLPADDQKEFLEGLGLGEPARNVFVRTVYAMLELVSFLTAGPDECRAWPIRRGTSARKAAGKVHSDIERGFIRAEIYRVEDLKAAGGSEAALKAQGKLRTEGKDYVMHDGDVANYRFNV
jgi:GTP-binding protein YchF